MEDGGEEEEMIIKKGAAIIFLHKETAQLAGVRPSRHEERVNVIHEIDKERERANVIHFLR